MKTWHLHLNLTVEWGPTAEVSPVESGINIKPIQSGNFSSISASVYKIKTPITFASAPIPVLLLYRRDVPQVSQRSSELRKQLQLDCGNQIKVIITGFSITKHNIFSVTVYSIGWFLLFGFMLKIDRWFFLTLTFFDCFSKILLVI